MNFLTTTAPFTGKGFRQLCLMLDAAIEGRGNHIYIAKGEEEAQAMFKDLLLLVPAGLIPVIDHEEMEIVISNGSRLKFNYVHSKKNKR